MGWLVFDIFRRLIEPQVSQKWRQHIAAGTIGNGVAICGVRTVIGTGNRGKAVVELLVKLGRHGRWDGHPRLHLFQLGVRGGVQAQVRRDGANDGLQFDAQIGQDVVELLQKVHVRAAAEQLLSGGRLALSVFTTIAVVVPRILLLLLFPTTHQTADTSGVVGRPPWC